MNHDTEIRARAVAAMVAVLPKKTADPERLAYYAYRVFRRALAFDTVSRLEDVLTAAKLHQAEAAFEAFEQTMAGILPADPDRRRDAWIAMGVDLEKLRDSLAALATVAVPDPPGGSGQNKQSNTVAAVAAALYLEDQGVKRQRAAKTVAVMMEGYPGVQAKPWKSIQDAMPENPAIPKKSVKTAGWGSYR